MTEHVSEPLNPNNAALLLIDHQVGTLNFGISDISALELNNLVRQVCRTDREDP